VDELTTGGVTMQLFRVLRLIMVFGSCAVAGALILAEVASSSNVDPIEVARAFLETNLAISEGAPQKREPSLVLGSSGFDRTTGWWRIIDSELATIRVSTTTGHVVWAVFKGGQPTEVPVVDSTGTPVSKERIRSETVRVSREDALGAAMTFAKRQVAQSELENLDLVRNELSDRGSHVAYYFVWRERADDDGVAYGMDLVSISVNPSTGKVFEYKHLTSAVDHEVLIRPDRCRSIVEAEHSGYGGLRITRLTLVSLHTQDGPEVPAWAVTFKVSTLLGEATKSCYVNADTGDILKETLDPY